MSTRNWVGVVLIVLILAGAGLLGIGMIQSMSLRSPFRRVAIQVSPAVVSIAADKLVQLSRPRNELDTILRSNPQSRPFGYRHALGTGFIFDPRGYVLTNYHVISGYEQIVVRLADGTEFKGDSVKTIGVDPWSDLAVLKIETRRRLPVARLGNSDQLRVGDWVAAVGNAFGLSGTLTAGVVSAFNRAGIPMAGGPQFQDFIQTDASINPGNSGGPLANEAGEVVGVNSGIRSPIQGNVGIGFAIPISYARAVADQLIAKGRIVRGYLGVDTQPIDEKIRQALKLEDDIGVLVSAVVPQGPAAKAGLKPGDVIVGLGTTPVNDIFHFQVLAAGAEPGSNVMLHIIRWGRQQTVTVRVAPRIEGETAAPAPPTSHYWLGLKVRNLSTAVIAAGLKGVVIEIVEPGSAAESAQLKVGDVITEIDGNEVSDATAYQRLAQLMARARRPLLFRVLHDRQWAYVAVGP